MEQSGEHQVPGDSADPSAADQPGLDQTAGAQELTAYGWEAIDVARPGGGGATVPGFHKGDFAVYAEHGVWQVVALPAHLLLGRLPSASAVRRFATKCISFPAQPNGAVIGAARQAMLQAVEEELALARQAAQQIEGRIDDLMSSIDDIRAKAILFSHDD